jgi:carboxymethylenebutenolidase
MCVGGEASDCVWWRGPRRRDVARVTMKTRTFELDTPDGEMRTFEAVPDGAPRGGIVVIQEAFGVTRHIEQVCERLAASDWSAIAPALFHRQGSPVFSYDTDFSQIRPVMESLTRAGLEADLAAAFGYLEAGGFGAMRRSIIGFCMGGAVALFAASEYALGAAVTFYGGGVSEGRFGLPSLIELAPSLKAPWLGAYADQDASIAVDDVERLRSAAATAPVDTQIIRYSEAGHGFNCDDRPAAYNAEAAADAWARALAFFAAHVA